MGDADAWWCASEWKLTLWNGNTRSPYRQSVRSPINSMHNILYLTPLVWQWKSWYYQSSELAIGFIFWPTDWGIGLVQDQSKILQC